MIDFNLDFGSNIYVDSESDSVTIRFDGDTFGINRTGDGFSLTNDWNNRHFTLGFDDDSFLYHVTRESGDEEGSGSDSIPPEEFIAEFYGYLRAVTSPIPDDRVPMEIVGKPDFDEMSDYMHEKGVIRESSTGLEVDDEARSTLVQRLNEEPSNLGELYQRVLVPVPIDEAVSSDSGENLFVYPTAESIFLLCVFPDSYVGITTVREVLLSSDRAGGSQMMDHILRAMART